jgi:glycosyltransferase involved in cell wall biosynthesis
MIGNNDMQVLVLHRYFWPQPYPYAQMLKNIVETLSIKHSVSVLTTNSGSSTEKDLRSEWSNKKNIKIDALSLGSEKRASMLKKSLNSLYFGLWLIYKLFSTKADTVMVATTPPVIIAMIVRWVSYFKKFKYVYHCQDIHPEAMLLGGNIQEGFIYKLLLNIDKKNINDAWKVITLSNDMRKTLEERGCKTSHINIINNFIFESSGDIATSSKNNKIQFLFAGSLGRLQNLTLLMDSLVLLKHRNDIQFIFMGDGIMYQEMLHCKESNKLDNVEFLGQRSLKEAVEAMRVADVGIVSISNNITSVAYPSKTMMYLGNGLPVMALVDEQTELYEFINSKEIGIAVAPSSPETIAKSIEQFASHLKQKPIDKHYVKNTANNFFGKQIVLNKFLEIFS